MSPGKWPIPWKRIFLWGWVRWESFGPGCTGNMPCSQKSQFQIFFLLFAPNIRILRSKLNIFVPRSLFEPRRSMFSTQKRCLIGSLICGYQNFYSLPKKMFDPKGPNFIFKKSIGGESKNFGTPTSGNQ